MGGDALPPGARGHLGAHEDWATHGLEHELSAFDTSITHGAGLACLFPAWMEHVHAENPARLAYYGGEVFGLAPTGDVCADALSAADETRQFFASLGMPTTLTDYSASARMRLTRPSRR